MEVKANRKHEIDHLHDPGDFLLTTRMNVEGYHGMIFVCPCGCSCRSAISFDTVPKAVHDIPRWHWDKNENSPTLSPSLNKLIGCRWHGYLKNGVFIKV